MDQHTSSKSSILSQALTRLKNAAMLHEDLPQLDVNTFDSSGMEPFEDFQRKLNIILECWKKQNSVTFANFEGRKKEIGNLTANELLRMLIQIQQNEELSFEGSCIIFKAGNDPRFAIFMIQKGVWECTTPSVGKEVKFKKYYDKIFDQAKCKKRASGRDKEFYSTDYLDKIRQRVQQKFENFFSIKMNDERFSEPATLRYYNTFFGVLTEIAKNITGCGIFREVPVAECVYLAVHNGVSHMLQDVFGAHDLPVATKWSKDYEAIPESNRLQWHDYVDQRKLKLRLKAALEIMKM